MMEDDNFSVGRVAINIPATLDGKGLADDLKKVGASRRTDQDAARRLIGHAAAEILAGRSLNEDFREWLGLALMGIANGVDPKTALCLNARGAPAKVSWEDLMPLIHDRIVAGDAWTTVCKDAAIELGQMLGADIDEKTVRLVYQENLKGWYDSWLIDDQIWRGDVPTPTELDLFRRFTFASICAIESGRKSVRRFGK
ncbi:hypothetical protein GO613_01360 [Azoarcus communis]|uniref:hypothetical protein n=1 Tax=Parazoarcus communis TaxID=41977 RepID=UPI0014597883|nr:hypothetical protein [Parazoarcus communis]NMG46757.1 hypothetical protein [Parazoarcus communis]